MTGVNGDWQMMTRLALLVVLPIVVALGAVWCFASLIRPDNEFDGVGRQPLQFGNVGNAPDQKLFQRVDDEPPAIPPGRPVPAVLDASPQPLRFTGRFGNAPTYPIVYCASADGRFYATADTCIFASGGYPMRLWDAKTGKQLRLIDGNRKSVLAAAFSPDGAVLATGGMDNTLRLWDTATGQQISEHGHYGQVYSIAWSQDGKFIATGSNDVKLWDIKQGKVVRNFLRPPPQPNRNEYFMQVVLSPDGRMVASQSEQFFRLWEIASGQQRFAIQKQAVSVLGDPLKRAFGFSADSKKLMATPTDARQLQSWDTIMGQKVAELALEGSLGPEELSSDGKWLAWNDRGIIRVRNLVLGKNVQALPKVPWDYPVSSFVFSGDAKRLLVASRLSDLVEYDVVTGKVTVPFIEAFQPVIGLASASKGQFIALTAEQGWVKRGWPYCDSPRPLQFRDWDVGSARELKRASLILKGPDLPLRLSTDGKLLLTYEPYKTIRVWDAAQVKTIATIEANWITPQRSSSLRFSPDAKKIVGLIENPLCSTADKEFLSIAIWNVATGQRTSHINASPATLSVAFTTDGENVLAYSVHIEYGGRVTGKIYVRDVKADKIVKVIALALEFPEPREAWPSAFVTHIEPSPDGKWLAVGEGLLTPVIRHTERPGSGPWLPRWYVKIVDTTTGLEKAVLPAGGAEREGMGLPNELPNMPLPMAWSRDSKWVATGHNAKVAVCDVMTWRTKLSTQEHQRQVTALHWLENGQLASGSGEGTIMLWDPAKGP
jgi:WD40 repeat protein